MRIGTWNLEGRWDRRHLRLIGEMACDILLLTEVSDRVEIAGMAGHRTAGTMAPQRHWAAIFAVGELTPLPDPHPASAMATIAGTRYCSSILPWRSCGAGAPWVGANVTERTEAATRAVAESAPDVWGGDWNHAMTGREWAGSGGGRGHITDALETLGLSVLTKDLPHRIDGLFTIDHLAVPSSWRVRTAQRYVASSEARRISDHDAYVAETAPSSAANRAQSG